jgi:hypothetical protein
MEANAAGLAGGGGVVTSVVSHQYPSSVSGWPVEHVAAEDTEKGRRGEGEKQTAAAGSAPVRKSRRRRRRKGKKGEGFANSELVERLKMGVEELEDAMQGGRGARARSCTAVTFIWEALREVSVRLGGEAGRMLERGGEVRAGAASAMVGTAEGRAAENVGAGEMDAHGDGEDAAEDLEEPRELSMGEVLHGPVDPVEERLEEHLAKTERTLEDLNEAAVTLEQVRVFYFRLLVDYLVVGCRTPERVTEKVLAMVRRVRPESMRLLGVSQSDVGRRLGKGRATVHAREVRAVEKPLKESGARGYKLLGGAKGEVQRENCRRAQMGNKNRVKGSGMGETRRRGEGEMGRSE